MTAVVKTLEPLLGLNDIPIGPFVYVVPDESGVVKMSGKDGNKDDENGLSRRRRKGHRQRHRIKPLRSNAVYSDTALYKTLGSSLYSSAQIGLQRQNNS